MKQKQVDWASSARQPDVFRGVVKHGDQAAMRAEPFHQQWFVLITHEKHQALKMLQSNTAIFISLLEIATEN